MGALTVIFQTDLSYLLLQECFGSETVCWPCRCIVSDTHVPTHEIPLMCQRRPPIWFLPHSALRSIGLPRHEHRCLCAHVWRALTFNCWRVKRATRVLNVLWPCKYLPVIHCWQTLCRGRRRPVESGGVGGDGNWCLLYIVSSIATWFELLKSRHHAAEYSSRFTWCSKSLSEPRFSMLC